MVGLMDVGGADVTANTEMEQPTQETPVMGLGDAEMDDDGVDDDEYASDIIENLENHLNSLPDEAKQFLSEYVTIPEFATAIGLINGKEVGDYFMKYVDPGKTISIQRTQSEPQAPMQPQAAAPQGQPAPQQASQGGLMPM